MIKVLIFKKEGCPPCKHLVDSINFSDEELDGVDIEISSVEHNLDAAIQYNVRSTPTTVVMNEYDRIIYSGTMVKDFVKLKELIKEARMTQGLSKNVMFNYTFPRIETLDDVKEVLKKPEFVLVKKDGYQVVNYVFQDKDTFTNPIEVECRGLIFDMNGKLLSRRYHKFFNVGEREDVIPDLSKPHLILEKLDGSMVSPLFIPMEDINIHNEVHLSLRWVTKMGITETSMQVEEWVSNHPQYIEFSRFCFLNNWTPIFEWMSPENRIVLNYGKESRLVLTAIRETKSGEYLDYFKLEYWCNKYDIPLVNKVNLPKYSNVVEYIRKQENMEGVVLRFLNGHMVKIKSEWYVKLHKTKDDICNESRVIRLILDEKIDDLVPLLCEEDKRKILDYQDSFFKHIIEFEDKLLSEYNLYHRSSVNKKEFASKVVNKPNAPMLFKLWDAPNGLTQTVLSYVERNIKHLDKVRHIIGPEYKSKEE